MPATRGWIVVINDLKSSEAGATMPAAELLPPWDQMKAVSYACYAPQRGAQGTLHWQCYVQLRRPSTLPTLKKTSVKKKLVLERAHLQPQRGTAEQARDYVLKGDTNLSPALTHGLFSPEVVAVAGAQGARHDLAEALKVIREEKLTEKQCLFRFPSLVARSRHFVSAAVSSWQTEVLPKLRHEAKIPAEVEEYLRQPQDRKVVWVTGPPGCGKTTLLNTLRHRLKSEGKAVFYSTLTEAKGLGFAYDREPYAILDHAMASVPCYEFIEHFMNDAVPSEKYGSVTKTRGDDGWLILASNAQPSYAKLAKDRIIYVRLDGPPGGSGGGEAPPVPEAWPDEGIAEAPAI